MALDNAAKVFAVLYKWEERPQGFPWPWKAFTGNLN
jgi:hypothetical protein